MKYRESDRQIEQIFVTDVAIPHTVKNTIREMNYTKKSQTGGTKMKKLIPLLTALVLVVSTTAAYATGLLDVLFQSENHAIGKALSNNYVQNVEMDYVQNGKIKSKVESLILDQGNIVIIFEHVLEEPVRSFESITLQDLKITDESGNVLFGDGDANALTTSFDQRYASEDHKTIKQGLFLMNNSGAFPKSQKIIISFTAAVFYDNSKPIQQFKGQWDFTVDVDEQFRTAQQYVYEAAPSDDITVSNAVLTPTGFQLTFEFAYPIDAMSLKMKLVDEDGAEYLAPNGFSVENETQRPLLHVNFEASSFEAKNNYQLVVTDTESDRIMTVVLTLSE